MDLNPPGILVGSTYVTWVSGIAVNTISGWDLAGIGDIGLGCLPRLQNPVAEEQPLEHLVVPVLHVARIPQLLEHS